MPNRADEATGWPCDLLLEACPVPAWIFDTGTLAFLSVNQPAVDLYGYSRSEFVGMTIRDIRPAEDMERLEQALRQPHYPSLWVGKVRHVRKNGEVLWVLLHARDLTYQGQPARLITAVDITEQERQTGRAEQKQRELEEQLERVEQATEAARRSEASFTILLEGTPDPILIHRDNRILYVNPAMVSLLGYPDADCLVGRPPLDLVAPASREGVAARIRRNLRGRSNPPQRQRLLRADGQEVVVEMLGVPVIHRGKDAVAAIGRDISKRLRVEEALRESQYIFEMAEELGQLGSWVWTPGAKSLRWSRETYRIFGRPPEEEVTSEDFLSAVHEDDRPMVERAVKHSLETGRYSVTARIVRPDGEMRWVRSQGRMIGEDGRPARMYGSIQDITALHEIQAERDRFLELSLDGHCTLELGTGQVRWSNPAFLRVLGYAQDEIVGTPFYEFLHPDDRSAAREQARRLRHGASLVEFVGRCRCSDGSYRTFSWKGVADLGRGLAYATGRDITEFQKLQEQFHQAQKMEAIGRLAGGVAHDFNNMLLVIMGMGDMALLGLPPDHPVRSDLEEILAAGRRAADLTQQLLAFSRKQVLRPQVLDLNQSLRDQERMLRRLIGEDIELELKLGDAVEPILADPGQLQQVVMNLAVNARDAMPAGGRLSLETTLIELEQEQATRRFARLAVRDTGVGMDREVRERIFEPFFTTKADGKGTGLGLSTVFGIVEQSGGTIRVDSSPGAGTCFELCFPCVDAPDREAAGPERARPGPGNETLLLVEDEAMVRHFLRRCLERAGYRVLSSADGQQAVELARDFPGPIHLVLADVVMPRMSGPAAVESILPLRPGIRVIYMSGYVEDELLKHLVSAADEFLQKPIRPADLLARVRAVLDRL